MRSRFWVTLATIFILLVIWGGIFWLLDIDCWRWLVRGGAIGFAVVLTLDFLVELYNGR